MNGYAVAARQHWAELMKTHKSKITKLTVVSSRVTHRMAGLAFGLFAGIPTEVLDEVPEFEAGLKTG